MTSGAHHSLPFSRTPALVGMVHLLPLPGTARCAAGLQEVIDRAVQEARKLADAGFDGLLLENMHDAPYLRREVGPEIVAAMTAVGCAVRASVSCPLGVQVLAGANRAALAVAHASGAAFIRAEGFVFSHVADEGLMEEADAGPLLRFRRAIGATDIAVWADIKKKHASHAVTSDVDLAETAAAAAFFGAAAVVVTGRATGAETSSDDLATVRSAVSLPVVVGSGATPDNLPAIWPSADAIIVGSALKQGGLWSNRLDAGRVKALVRRADQLR